MEPNLKRYDLTSPQTNKLTSRALTAIRKRIEQYNPIIYYSSKVRFSGISIVKVYIRS